MNASKKIEELIAQHADDHLDYSMVSVKSEGVQVTYHCTGDSDMSFTADGIEINCGDDTDRILIKDSAVQDIDIFENDYRTVWEEFGTVEGESARCILRAESWIAVLEFAWVRDPVV